jgi:hypothetical protein
MNDRQQRLYNYLMRYKMGAFNSIANSRWTDDMRSLNMEDEVRAAGRYIDDVAGEGIREMWRKGIDDDVAGLSRKEIREVAEAVYLFALKKKQERMGDRRSVEDIMKTYRAESRISVDKIITEAIDSLVNEADRHRPGYFDGKPDRHREGYWKERWAKQKSEKEKNDNNPTVKKPVKKDRHKPGYYRKYNKQHPERLNRGFTKGFNNGNVDDGRVGDNGVGKEIFPGVYIIGYDELGR